MHVNEANEEVEKERINNLEDIEDYGEIEYIYMLEQHYLLTKGSKDFGIIYVEY